MRFLVWGLLALLVTWVSAVCLFVLLGAAGVTWLPGFALQLREQLIQPVTFASWVALPTLLCCLIQIWQGQYVQKR